MRTVRNGMPVVRRHRASVAVVPALVLMWVPALTLILAGCVSLAGVDPRDAEELVALNVSQGELVRIDDVEMPQLERTRDVFVYLPPGYESSGIRYPVIYMHDGQNLFDGVASPNRHWMVDSIIDAHVAMGLYDGVIVVGIRSNAFRISEYTPYDFSYGGNSYETRASDYAAFLVDTLKPMIDERFRTEPARESTHIAGSSLGAFVSLYTALEYPDVYGGIGAFSSAVWPADFAFLEDLRAYEGRTDFRLYLDMGTWEGNEPVEQTRIMAEAFEDLGFETMRVVFQRQGVHTESAWRSRFPAALLWLLDVPAGENDGAQ